MFLEAGAAQPILGRQGAAGTHLKGRLDRHSATADHWCNVSAELDGTQVDPGRIMARGNAFKKAANVGRDRIGQ